MTIELVTDDPDVPRLRAALETLQDGVAAGALTPAEANRALGNMADAMAESRRRSRRSVIRYDVNGIPWPRTR